MNVLAKILIERIRELEARGNPQADPWRPVFHLAPPVGWLNDPNGLCQWRGVYHVFFQYSPFDAGGGLKVWGHYTSRDLTSWRYEGTPLLPDGPWDCHGVYSGSAYPEGERLHLFYTGNVKLDGDYDYVHDGRLSETLRVSGDGFAFGEKRPVLRMEDYPDSCTCHVRDPKVWGRHGGYAMVLGARLKGDSGAALLYGSRDLSHWEYERTVTTESPFGYMWECPDLFTLRSPSGPVSILSISPQGVPREALRFQNRYASGYFFSREADPDPNSAPDPARFIEWDYGFDFYAPQTFEDEGGRRILIGWAGMPDSEEEYGNPTEGWRHVLTVPRELTCKDGGVLQRPLEELKRLRDRPLLVRPSGFEVRGRAFDLVLEGIRGEPFELSWEEGFSLLWKEGVFSLSFLGDAGAGRTVRRVRLEALRTLRLLVDRSVLEVYLNEGEAVMTSRFYPNPNSDSSRLRLSGDMEKAEGWTMRPMPVAYPARSRGV